MRAAPSPRLHLFVCANRRDGSPLGPGCGEHGDALYDALKAEVGARQEVTRVWVTKSLCLGICPKRGATVARYPSTQPILADVEVSDVPALLEPEAKGPDTFCAIDRELVAVEELQTQKVLELARRLKPGLTLEDVQNPHDFPELDDPDWHYADGILTGIKSVAMALRALERRMAAQGGND